MNNFFYSKLAVQNLKNNRKTYVPYILTCIFTTAMFFVVGTIANIKWADSDALHSLLTFALATVGIFSAISLLNNVKRNSDYTTFSVWKNAI